MEHLPEAGKYRTTYLIRKLGRKFMYWFLEAETPAEKLERKLRGRLDKKGLTKLKSAIPMETPMITERPAESETIVPKHSILSAEKLPEIRLYIPDAPNSVATDTKTASSEPGGSGLPDIPESSEQP